jgi:predicted aspartyl protease
MNSPLVPLIVIGILAVVLLFAVLGGDSTPSGDGLSGDRIAQIIYAVALLSMMAAFALPRLRENLGQSIQYLLIWGVIVVGIVLAYSMRGQFGF